MPRTSTVHAVTAIGIDMGKNTLHMVGLDSRGAIVLREKISHGRIALRLAAPPINEMKSRRLIASPEAYEHWFKLARIADQCPLWVKSGRHALKFRCPLCP